MYDFWALHFSTEKNGISEESFGGMKNLPYICMRKSSH